MSIKLRKEQVGQFGPRAVGRKIKSDSCILIYSMF